MFLILATVATMFVTDPFLSKSIMISLLILNPVLFHNNMEGNGYRTMLVTPLLLTYFVDDILC